FLSAVLLSGTTVFAASTRSSVVISRLLSLNAANSASGTIAAISEPVKPSQAVATFAASTATLPRPFARNAALSTATRSVAVGRSIHHSSSNRPFRKNSGGKADTSLAVIITNASEVRSCIHVRTAPIASDDTPPSADPDVAPCSAFSTSSNHTTQKPMASITLKTLRRFCSLSPTNLLFKAPRSTRNNGHCHAVAIALAVSDLPQPEIPTSMVPFGRGNP